jgi:transposase-like protein
VTERRSSLGTRCPECDSRDVETVIRGTHTSYHCLACHYTFIERRAAAAPETDEMNGDDARGG